MSKQWQDLVKRYPSLAACRADAEKAFALMRDCFRAGGKMLLCGNGGSAADAEHWSGELLKGFCSKRPLAARWRKRLGKELASKLQEGLPAIPLSGFLSLTSAFANDVDPQLAYAQLTWALGRPGDVLVGLSTSGNARNVIAAMRVARARGMKRVGLTGETGGKLLNEVDVCIRVPERETYKVQELHLPLYHALCLMLEEEFFGHAH